MSSARTSPVWQFRAGIDPRHTPIDSSWGTVSDLDGDGHPELLESSLATGAGNAEVRIFRGPIGSASTAPAWTLRNPTTDIAGFGRPARNIGDVNGDGFSDLAIAAPYAMGGAGRLYIYFGSATGPSSTASQQIDGPDGASSLLGLYSDGIVALGDTNGDGFADIAVSSLPMGLSQPGRYVLGLGSASGIQFQRGSFVGPSATLLRVFSAGDLNGDRIADFAETSFDPSSSTTLRLRIWLGSTATGSSSTPREVSAPSGSTPNTSVFASGADIDADGFADLAFVATNSSCGDCTRFAISSGSFLVGSQYQEIGPSIPSSTDGYWSSALMPGDLNGDGYGDIVLARIGYMAPNQLEVFLGSSGLLSSTASLVIRDPIANQMGDQLLLGPRVDDLDGDGFSDVLFRTIHGQPPAMQLTRWYSVRGGASPALTSTWNSALPTDNTVQIGF